MKKIFTLLLSGTTALVFAQNIAVYGLGNGCARTSTITNGGIISVATTASQSTSSVSISVKKFDAQNLSASTVTLNVTRYVIYQSPSLKLDGLGNLPDTYFCFGNCFPSNVSTAPISDWQVLGPVGSATAPFDNMCANSGIFTVDLEEGLTIGKYFVRYKIFNVNNPNDSLSFTVKYNEFLSVNENAAVIESVGDVYPNPSNNHAYINLNLNSESPVKVQVYNSLGALVYNGTEQKLAAGKNKVAIDCGNFTSGLYFMSLTAGNSKVTKRLIVEK
jgi:hypothetical protein